LVLEAIASSVFGYRAVSCFSRLSVQALDTVEHCLEAPVLILAYVQFVLQVSDCSQVK
jgi:hypothetical protein